MELGVPVCVSLSDTEAVAETVPWVRDPLPVPVALRVMLFIDLVPVVESVRECERVRDLVSLVPLTDTSDSERDEPLYVTVKRD